MTEVQLFKNTPGSLKSYVIAAVLGDGTNMLASAQVDIQVPFKGVLSKLTILAKESGSVTVNISKDTFAGFPGGLADITGNAPPALEAAQKFEESAFVGWTTAFAVGDVLRLLTSGEATITQITVLMEILKEAQ